MNRNLQLILTATTASFLAFPVMAQQNTSPTSPKSDRGAYGTTPSSTPDRSATGRDGTNRSSTNTNRSATGHDGMMNSQTNAQLHSTAKASDIVGMTVNNYQEEKLGSVQDLAVDLESGRIVQVILSTGGFIGMGDRLSAVPPGALHYDAAKKVLHLDANKEKLKGAPEFRTERWKESYNSESLSGVYSYYGQEPALTFIEKGDTTDANARSTTDANARATTDANARSKNDANARAATNRNSDGNWNKDRATGKNQWMIPASRLSQIEKASSVMGMAVKNRQDERIGKVDDMLVDVQSGRIVAVVLSTGGFLGLDDELSAVPPSALGFNGERESLQLDTTKDMLIAAPHFRSNQWPDFNEPAYSASVYSAYKMEPYFSTHTMAGDHTAGNMRDRDGNQSNRQANTDASAQRRQDNVANQSARDADNTGRNTRDRDDRTLTPLDQGNSKSDTDTTAQIRKGILAGKNMSANAKNVKIITNNGRVTLRGPVGNEEEKRMIGEIANRIARAENVDNQLDVTRKSASN